MKKIVALISTNDKKKLKEFCDKWNTNNPHSNIEAITEVPFDTTLKEIKDVIVENRSKKIEEEYADDLHELA